MKMSERIKRNMQPDKPMTLISLRLPDHIIEDLKEVAPSLGFGGYQALIRAYISNGLRKHLTEREAQRAKDSTVEEFSRRLMAHGVPEQAIQDAAAEMVLVQGAQHILGPFGEDSDLRRWGLKLAGRGGKRGKKRAIVAVARKLAVLLHHLWISCEEYEPLYNTRKERQLAA